MYRVVINIKFEQQPTVDFPNRKATLLYDFANEYEASDSWADLTNKASIVLPKNTRLKDGNGNILDFRGPNVNIGGFYTNAPQFLRGDKVTIESGYRYSDAAGNEVKNTSTIFTGYISNVASKQPITLECEDSMWILKQNQAVGGVNGFFDGKKYTVESMFREMIKNAQLPYTVHALTNTSLGDYMVRDRSIGQVLEDLNKKYNFKAYFRGNELRIGSLVYVDQDNVVNGAIKFNVFKFQQNIISDELEYKRKDDVMLSAVAHVVDTVLTGKATKDGLAKTKKERISVLVTYLNGKFHSYIKKKDQDFPANITGERREFNYLPPKTATELIDLAKKQLDRYYYEGFRGKFTTFAIPFVQQGSNVTIIDPILPERNGNYKVKSVKYKGGVGGLRQEIELDYKIK